ncbi:uncharacterized protein BYT42DRAFT_221768 [Radiomyces spectabilis]|uniref:uncharacterized protein n=1 Tax=Radiomyces spectabilis TaxID=64574 RepID=UPI00221FF925|nr:uncharacterized protein BYT42DRAFT_221768 [Radiomyces spectabilis]KAI8388099.1 hypothetical protein BYT42DRAFT_221768 [Radiomyces spectabilis]
MATVEDLICLKHSIYKELKACLEPEDKAKTVLQKLEAKCTEHSDIIYSQQTLVFRLKKASKREYLELQNLENAGLFKSMLHSHKVKVEEQREKHRKAFQAEKEAVVHLENVQAEKENLSKQILVAQQEYQRYKGQHLQLNQFITDIFKEANNAENYPELSALTEKIGQENQAKSRCQTENYQAEKKKREISSAIQSLGKACKALTLGINASTLLDTLSSKGDHKHSLNGKWFKTI